MDYDRFRATALRLISNFGNALTATIYREAITYDPLTQAETRTVTAHAIEVVTTDLDRILDRDMLGIATMKAYVPAAGLAIVPKQKDQIALPARTGRFVIKQVKPYDPDGAPIMYELFLGQP
jgi:hypothetical protein